MGRLVKHKEDFLFIVVTLSVLVIGSIFRKGNEEEKMKNHNESGDYFFSHFITKVSTFPSDEINAIAESL